MRTDYAGHDLAYQRKRAAGELGWGSAQDLAEHFASLERALARPEFPATGKLMELGCGAGNVALWFARRGYAVHGVDISPTAIAWAQERAAEVGAEFTVGNVVDLAGDASFDVVLDGHCFHCIIGEDRPRFLASAWRLVKEQGVLCIHTMCGEPVNDTIRAQFDEGSRCLVRDGIATRYVGLPEEIAREVNAAGFRITFSEIEVAPSGDQSMLLLLAVK